VVVETETLIMTMTKKQSPKRHLFALIEQFAREGSDFGHRTHVLRSAPP
jgi:hypothetical protein